MSQIIEFLLVNYGAILAGIIGILSGVITIALVIPGDQPEKSLQGVVNFLSKFSKK